MKQNLIPVIPLEKTSAKVRETLARKAPERRYKRFTFHNTDTSLPTGCVRFFPRV